MWAKLFVCEFITGGGFAAEDLPNKLALEGKMMRDALLHDVLDTDLTVLKCQILTTHDARTPIEFTQVQSVCVRAEDDCWQVWAGQIAQSDAVWVIAPETDGILQKFAELTLRLGKVWLGCAPKAIEICADKLKTHDFLQPFAAAIPTFNLAEFLKQQNSHFFQQGYICKPIDGAGCEATFWFENSQNVIEFMRNGHEKTHIIQQFIAGKAASLTMLLANGQAKLLSCNQQLIDINNRQVTFKGVIVNGFAQYHSIFQSVVAFLSLKLPDLHGFVGVDVVFDDSKMTIIEINPRLTTSYVALRESIGHNPAQLFLQSLQQANFAWPALAAVPITIEV